MRYGGFHYPFLTQKERDSETGLDYFLARYYSSTQGRFTSVDPGQEGAREPDPQSWNGYAYTGGNPINRIDPDGKKYLVCDTNGKNCQEVGDEDFYTYRRNDTKNGFTYTGSRDFFEYGQIKTSDGTVVGTYVQISIDTDTPAGEQRAKIFELRRQTAPIPGAVMDFFEISVELGTGGGLLGYTRTRATIEELNLGGAPRPVAAQRLGRLNGLNRADARAGVNEERIPHQRSVSGWERNLDTP
jgi:RHS repeat-associated protein